MSLPASFLNQWSQITDDEETVLDLWYRGDLWADVCPVLRGSRKTVSASVRRAILILDRMTTQWPLTRPMRVFRAAHTRREPHVGDVFSDPCFLSVATYASFAERFFGGRRTGGYMLRTFLRMELSATSTAACITPCITGYESQWRTEEELLLPRNTRFLITSVKHSLRLRAWDVTAQIIQ